jgi:hypothetical protein
MPSPWSGRSKPPVSNSEPGGPRRICVVAAQGLVVEVAEHDHVAFLAVVVEERVGGGPDGRGLGGAAGERVVGVAGALALVGGLEPAGEREQL